MRSSAGFTVERSPKCGSWDKERKAIDSVMQQMGLPSDAIVQAHAPTVDDALRYVSTKRFTIIYFSGHGIPSGIFMESASQDGSAIVGVEYFRRILKQAKPYLSAA